jgi:NADPH-dependent curcumin reductase CurA
MNRSSARVGHLTRHLCESTGGNTQIVIAELPKGPLALSNFVEHDAPVPELKDGEVLVQTLAITIGAGQRAGLQGSASYTGAATANVPMNGTGVGRVVKSLDATFDEGDLVMGATGWQEFAALPGKSLTSVAANVDPATMLGALGTNGLTAYFGLLEIGEPKQGDTVVVSGAAGSVGHIVGQIAKIKGARVVGVAGSEEKCRYLTNDLGFDAAVNYKSKTFREDFKAATPKRIDVYVSIIRVRNNTSLVSPNSSACSLTIPAATF